MSNPFQSIVHSMPMTDIVLLVCHYLQPLLFRLLSQNNSDSHSLQILLSHTVHLLLQNILMHCYPLHLKVRMCHRLMLKRTYILPHFQLLCLPQHLRHYPMQHSLLFALLQIWRLRKRLIYGILHPLHIIRYIRAGRTSDIY